MSVATSTRVWKRSTKGGAALLLLLAMADWSDDWGYCYPSLVQMANKCRQTERNILNLIRELEAGRRTAPHRARERGPGQIQWIGLPGHSRHDRRSKSQPVSRSRRWREPHWQDCKAEKWLQPVPRKTSTKTGEKISPENFSPEKTESRFFTSFTFRVK